MDHESERDESAVYEIRVRGWLSVAWCDWFEGMTVTQEAGGSTLLAGPVLDQAELHGILNRIRDLGLTLVAVQLAEASSAGRP